MGLFKNKAKFLFKTGELPDLRKYVGMKVVLPPKGDIPPQVIVIKKIVGNVFKPQFYEINGEHLIGMLRFHAQMCKDKSITEEQFVAFEEMDMSAEKLPDTPSAMPGFEAEARGIVDKVMKDVKNEPLH